MSCSSRVVAAPCSMPPRQRPTSRAAVRSRSTSHTQDCAGWGSGVPAGSTKSGVPGGAGGSPVHRKPTTPVNQPGFIPDARGGGREAGLTVKGPLQLLLFQQAGGRQQSVETIQRGQQVQQGAEQGPRHRHGQQQQGADDLTQHAAGRRHIEHVCRGTGVTQRLPGHAKGTPRAPLAGRAAPYLSVSPAHRHSRSSPSAVRLSGRRCPWREVAGAAGVCATEPRCWRSEAEGRERGTS